MIRIEFLFDWMERVSIMNVFVKKMKLVAGVCFAVGLIGCANQPPITHQPMTSRPIIEDVKQKSPSNGSLFSTNTYKSLYDTKKPMKIGDVLTIVITERTQANTQSNTDISKTAGFDASVSGIAKLPFKSFNGLGGTAESNQTFSGTGSSAINNAFNGSITVTVIERYENGNLLVSGEKQLAINQGMEFVRFSGVVNPDFISDNQVASGSVADARLEYRQSGVLNGANVMGWLGRVFMSVLPF